MPESPFNKVAGLRAAALLKKRLWHRCFPVNFAKFKSTFLTEHPGFCINSSSALNITVNITLNTLNYFECFLPLHMQALNKKLKLVVETMNFFRKPWKLSFLVLWSIDFFFRKIWKTLRPSLQDTQCTLLYCDTKHKNYQNRFRLNYSIKFKINSKTFDESIFQGKDIFILIDCYCKQASSKF